MEFNYGTIDKELTLFYSLNTGKIKSYCTGVQTMDYYGEDKDDYNYGVIVVENDNFIIQNLESFKVIDEGLEYIPPMKISKYLKKD